MTSFTEINFMTLFQSLGLFWFLLHFVFSLFQFAWSWSVRKETEFSFESGKKSFSSYGRSLPVLKIPFIHWKKRRDTKLTLSLSSLGDILLYPFLAITVNLKINKDQHLEITIEVWQQNMFDSQLLLVKLFKMLQFLFAWLILSTKPTSPKCSWSAIARRRQQISPFPTEL